MSSSCSSSASASSSVDDNAAALAAKSFQMPPAQRRSRDDTTRGASHSDNCAAVGVVGCHRWRNSASTRLLMMSRCDITALYGEGAGEGAGGKGESGGGVGSGHGEWIAGASIPAGGFSSPLSVDDDGGVGTKPSFMLSQTKLLRPKK